MGHRGWRNGTYSLKSPTWGGGLGWKDGRGTHGYIFAYSLVLWVEGLILHRCPLRWRWLAFLQWVGEGRGTHAHVVCLHLALLLLFERGGKKFLGL